MTNPTNQAGGVAEPVSLELAKGVIQAGYDAVINALKSEDNDPEVAPKAVRDFLNAALAAKPAAPAERWNAVVQLAHRMDDAAHGITEREAYDFATELRVLAGLDGEEAANAEVEHVGVVADDGCINWVQDGPLDWEPGTKVYLAPPVVQPASPAVEVAGEKSVLAALRAELQGAANYIDVLGGDSKKYRIALATTSTAAQPAPAAPTAEQIQALALELFEQDVEDIEATLLRVFATAHAAAQPESGVKP